MIIQLKLDPGDVSWLDFAFDLDDQTHESGLASKLQEDVRLGSCLG